MIKVGKHTSEVGDKVKTKKAGKLIIKSFDLITQKINNPIACDFIKFEATHEDGSFRTSYNYKLDGKSMSHSVLDIVEIIKAPKPDVVTRFIDIHLINTGLDSDIYYDLETMIRVDSNSGGAYPSCGFLKVKIDKANKKILSVEIVED